MKKPKNKRACIKCLEEKELTEFYFGKKAKKPSSYCKGCERTDRRRFNWKYRDGIDPDQAEHLRSTVTACEICGKENKKLHIDHIHGTDKIRGVLCFKCNSALGNFNDDVILLVKAIKYLGKENT